MITATIHAAIPLTSVLTASLPALIVTITIRTIIVTIAARYPVLERVNIIYADITPNKSISLNTYETKSLNLLILDPEDTLARRSAAAITCIIVRYSAVTVTVWNCIEYLPITKPVKYLNSRQ